MSNPKLSVVKEPPPEPVDVAAMWREEARQRDWARVHIEGDRNPPVFLSLLRWVHRL